MRLELWYNFQKRGLENTLPTSDFDPKGISKIYNIKTLTDYEIINKLFNKTLFMIVHIEISIYFVS